MKCTSLRLLKPQQPYKIVHVQMDERVAILHLKEAGSEEFMCLMFRDLIPKFLEAIWMNNGVSAGLKLKFYGCSDVGTPIIRISGKPFVQYLVWESRTVCPKPWSVINKKQIIAGIFLFQINMRVNGQNFSVSTTRYEDLRRLRASAGNCTRFQYSTPYIFRTVHTSGVSYTTSSVTV